MKNILALCMLVTSLFIAGTDSSAISLQAMMRENKTVTPYDSCSKRTIRNLERCYNNPDNFCKLACCGTPEAREHDLIEYVMNQSLTINGQKISGSNNPKAMEMCGIFEDDQKINIKEYIATRSENNIEEVCATGCCIAISTTSIKVPCILSSALLALFSYASGEQ